eukprot:1163300-Prymnesium_polylepis.1
MFSRIGATTVRGDARGEQIAAPHDCKAGERGGALTEGGAHGTRDREARARPLRAGGARAAHPSRAPTRRPGSPRVAPPAPTPNGQVGGGAAR